MNFPILLFISFVFLVLGLTSLIIINIIKKFYNNLYQKCTNKTIGIVDSISERLGSNNTDSLRTYYPTYKYIVNGQNYYCRGNNGSYKKQDINVEDKTIYYNPNNPIESYVDKKTNDLVIKIFNILGIVFTIIGGVLLIIKIILK